jgi:hypothetical protein
MSKDWVRTILDIEKRYVGALLAYEAAWNSQADNDDESMKVYREAAEKLNEERDLYLAALRHERQQDDEAKIESEVLEYTDKDFKKTFPKTYYKETYYKEFHAAKDSLENTDESKAYREAMRDLNKAIDAYPRDQKDLEAKREAKKRAWEELEVTPEYKTYHEMKNKAWE